MTDEPQARPGTPRHNLTAEERARGASEGGKARAAKFAEARNEARRVAAERLSGIVDRAIDELAQLIDDDDARVRLRTAYIRGATSERRS
jgi:hypothetical protein